MPADPPRIHHIGACQPKSIYHRLILGLKLTARCKFASARFRIRGGRQLEFNEWEDASFSYRAHHYLTERTNSGNDVHNNIKTDFFLCGPWASCEWR